MKMSRLCIPLLVFLIFSMGLPAQEVDLKKHPGYVDLDQIKIPARAENVVDIDLGPALLALMSLGSDDEDNEFSNGIAGIISIKVKSFEIGHGEAEEIRSYMKKFEKQLEQDNWVRLIRTKSRDEMTNVSMRIVEGKVMGFFLMSIDSDNEVSFANICGGNIDLEGITKFGMGLKGSTIDSLKKGFEKYKH